MTEKEAATKWCPFVRVIGEGDTGSINRWPTDHDDRPNPFGDHNACIGSACMMWEWARVSNPALKDWAAAGCEGELPEPQINSTKDGDCGLKRGGKSK